jgi:hypothetical protein
MTDADTALDALRIAEALGVAARKEFGDAQQELQDHAAVLRETRWSPSHSLVQDARSKDVDRVIAA